jgi:methyl-accepting chemotaxis protein
MLLAVLGVILTLSGLAIALKRSYDLAYEAKRGEIQHEGEIGASLVRHFVKLEKDGKLSREDAQHQAIDAMSGVQFDGVNYIAIVSFDGVSLWNANTSLIGKDISALKDANGNPVTGAQLAVAKSGTPGFASFYWKKIGESDPKLKMSYNTGIPEWGWDVTTGQFADDLNAQLFANMTRLAAIFIPLFCAYLVIVYLMRRAVTEILGSLSNAMRSLASGNLDTEIVGRDRTDDLGHMAEALVTFRQAAVEKLRIEETARKQQAETERLRLIHEETQRRVALEQAQVVEQIGAGLANLSAGDLTFRLRESFAGEYEKLREDFNAAILKLSQTMRGIVGRATGLRSGGNEITQAADDLSRRTETQAASLEETAAAMDEITATVGKTADGAIEARRVVSSAKSDAEESGAIVDEAVSAMNEIESSSRQISQIIGVIDEIAFQTNLLALNAAVEAARAGEAGRGFAVVAAEVRILAKRSADAAKEIKGLISTSTQQVAQGVERVAATGRALGRIAEQVSDINTVVSEIADAAQEQAKGLQQINAAVIQMDSTTQQNAAMVEEMTAAAHNLRNESDMLTDLISRFKVGDQDEMLPPATRSGSARLRAVS